MDYGNQLKNYEKRLMHSKASKIHEFPFNATKQTAQGRDQASASQKLETIIVSLVQKRISLCQSLGFIQISKKG